MLLVVAMAFLLTLGVTESRAQARDDAAAQPPSIPKKPLRLETFADRVTLKTGETINVNVWIESKLLEDATIAVFFASDQLALEEAPSRQISLPTDSPTTFTFMAKSTGKSNMVVRVTGINKATQEPIAVSRQIQGIEVQSRAQWGTLLFSSSLFGVVIGALLTFGTTWLNEYRQRRKEAVQRKQWIIANLPALLEFDRTAVLDGRETKFESWRGKLLTEGYYVELEKLIEQRSDLTDLAQPLIRAGFRLQDYEDLRLKKRLDLEFQQSLATELEEIIQGLGKLRVAD